MCSAVLVNYSAVLCCAGAEALCLPAIAVSERGGKRRGEGGRVCKKWSGSASSARSSQDPVTISIETPPSAWPGLFIIFFFWVQRCRQQTERRLLATGTVRENTFAFIGRLMATAN